MQDGYTCKANRTDLTVKGHLPSDWCLLWPCAPTLWEHHDVRYLQQDESEPCRRGYGSVRFAVVGSYMEPVTKKDIALYGKESGVE